MDLVHAAASQPFGSATPPSSGPLHRLKCGDFGRPRCLGLKPYRSPKWKVRLTTTSGNSIHNIVPQSQKKSTGVTPHAGTLDVQKLPPYSYRTNPIGSSIAYDTTLVSYPSQEVRPFVPLACACNHRETESCHLSRMSDKRGIGMKQGRLGAQRCRCTSKALRDWRNARCVLGY